MTASVAPTPTLTPPPSLPPRPARMPGLDGIRGLAVLLVLLDHASDAEMRFFPGADLNRAGKYGVYLFFVLSAFLLTRQLSILPAQELIKAQTWIHYSIRRFLRIFPLYAVVLLAYLLMHKLQAHQLLTHLLLRDGINQFWSIPVEVKFYLVLPFVAIACFWAWPKHWGAGLAAGLGVVAICLGLFAIEQSWSLEKSVWLSTNIAPFIIGSLVAIGSGNLSRNPVFQGKLAWGFELAGSVALLTILARIPAIHDLLFVARSSVGKKFDPIVCGVLWSVFLLGVLHGKGYWNRVMQWKPLRYLGLISFSAYLWHRKFLNDVDDVPLPTLGRLLLYLAIVIAVSSVSYFLVERPLAGLARKLTRRGCFQLPPLL